MKWTDVESSQIRRVAWREDTPLPSEAGGILTVEFHGGGTYEYRGVPLEVFTNLTQAVSVGSFFGKEIKPKYFFRRIEEPWFEPGTKR